MENTEATLETAEVQEPVPASPITTSGVQPVSRASSLTNASRRKPVPPPKDETTLPQWVVSQTTKKVKRRPVSVASVLEILFELSNTLVYSNDKRP